MAPRLGLLGGTYDPPHVGHLIVAQDVCEELDLDRLLIVPAGSPPHRETVFPSTVRLQLVELAFGSNPRFEVSRVELERSGPSFTVDTLRWIRRTLAPGELFCVIGADQLRVIDTWSRYREIAQLARLTVMAREGEAPSAGSVDLPFETVAVTRVDVAASTIRKRLREGRSIRYLVPESIRARVETEWQRTAAAAAAGRPASAAERNAK
ncbi:MAG: nicotinate (nicotinamide) nucleotide adenylyltransferase [Gemmatimonadota bacterium]|nr:MAG: nicotinate (nicotinamide) nucleotide adenylyltransferase [Gemmatimonadota bacterium]